MINILKDWSVSIILILLVIGIGVVLLLSSNGVIGFGTGSENTRQSINQGNLESETSPLKQAIEDLTQSIDDLSSLLTQGATSEDSNASHQDILALLNQLEVSNNSNQVSDSIILTDPVDKDSINETDLPYSTMWNPYDGYNLANPVFGSLFISQAEMEADSEYFASCMSMNQANEEVDCYIDIYVTLAAQVTWDYPNATILSVSDMGVKFVQFPDTSKSSIENMVAKLPARIDLFANGCNEFIIEVWANIPNKNNDIPFSRYRLICV